MDIFEAQYDAFLEHHGVKGQRWGVRRANRRAELLKRHVEKRPTRGNIRTAQRAQIRANRLSSRVSRVDAGTEARKNLTKKQRNKLLLGAGLGVGGAAIIFMNHHSSTHMSAVRTPSPELQRANRMIKAQVASLRTDHQDDMAMLRKLSSNISASEQARRLAAMKLGLPLQQ